MVDLFFFGTLRHLPLLEIVLDRPTNQIETQADVLADHAVLGVREGPFPTIVARKGAQAKGLRVGGLTDDDIDRLNFYEGSFAYDLVTHTLQSGAQAQVYMPRPDQWTPAQPWSLANWIETQGAMNGHAAREVMRLMGHKTQEQVAQMFPRIRARAASKARAEQNTQENGTFRGQVELTKVTPAYASFFALDDINLRHARFDGTLTDTIERAVLISSDAAIVLPYDPTRDRVMLVEQVRMGPVMRGDPNAWQLEPVAGLIDAGETPQEAARREAVEEAGLTLSALEPVGEVYSSPGNSTGYYYIYLGLTDLLDGSTGIGGLADENEDIRSHLLSFDELMALVDDHKAANAPLVIAAYWLARHRDRLRSGQGAATPLA